MINFNSIQEALAYVFDNQQINILRIHNDSNPWFFVDEIRTAIGYTMDNFALTKNLEFRDKVIGILTLPEYDQTWNHINDMVSSSTVNTHGGARQFMIISLPGLFELLTKSRMPRAKAFREWLYFTILPTLYHNPNLVQEINRLAIERDNISKYSKNYYDELVRIRNNDKTIRDLVEWLKFEYDIHENVSYESQKDVMDILYNLLSNNKIQICHIVK